MSKLIYYISILFFFNLSAKSCQKKTNQWEQLKTAAHKIGLCVYHTDEDFCFEHKNEFSKREQSINPEEEDLYYFEMKEDWAKKRVADHAGFEKRAKEEYLILYDVRQGPFVFKDKSKVETSSKSFVIVNLKDDFLFSQRTKTDYFSDCFIESTRENSIVENIFWREYMTGRGGRLVTRAIFSKLKHKEKFNFDNFIKAFSSYQESKE